MLNALGRVSKEYRQNSGISIRRLTLVSTHAKSSEAIINKTYNLTLHYVRQKMHYKLHETLIKIILMTA